MRVYPNIYVYVYDSAV